MTSEAIQKEGGPAAGVRWDLSHLFAGPDDPAIDAALDQSLAGARAFAERYRGRLASLEAADLCAAVDAYEEIQEPAARAGAYAGLLFAADTATPRHGALLQHVQERSTEIGNELLFFELEWVAVPEERAATLLLDPALARRRMHHLLEGAGGASPDRGVEFAKAQTVRRDARSGGLP